MRSTQKKRLLILDSFEEVIAEEGELCDLLAETTALHVLITSQERLLSCQENNLSLLGLAYPPVGTPAQEVPQFAAIALFIESAKRIEPGFMLTADNAAAIVAICQVTAGFPLGILLAAGLCGTLSCPHIAALVQKAPDRLAATLPGIEERHQNLSKVFEVAWQQLPPDVQTVFCQLSVFNGGFSVNAVSAVLTTTEQPVDFFAESFIQLVQRSLVRKEQDRYLLLGPLRDFARQKLVATGNALLLLDRHSQYFVQELEKRATRIQREISVAADSLFLEWFDLRSGLLWLLKRQGPTTAAAPIDTLREFLYLQSRHQELVEFLQEALSILQTVEHDDTSTELRADWQLWIGIAYYKNGQPWESKAALLQTLEVLGEPVDFLRGVGMHPPIRRELVTQVLLRLLPWLCRRPGPQRHQWELKARAFDMLGQIFFFDGQATYTEYVTVRSANLAELSKAPKDLLARTFANLCVGIGLDPVARPLAALYATVSDRLATDLLNSAYIPDRATSAYVFTALCLYEIAIANLYRGRLLASRSARVNQEVANHRQYIEAVTMEINTSEFAGDFSTACSQWMNLRTAAAQRADKQVYRWAIAGEIENRLYLGTETAIDLLDQADATALSRLIVSTINDCINESDHSILLNLYGLLATVSLRYQIQPTLESALRSLQVQTERQQITKLTDFFGYAAAAGVAVTLEEQAVAAQGGTHSLQSLPFLPTVAAGTCQSLWRFARIFPVARCRAFTCYGLHLHNKGHLARANHYWQRSIQRAEKYGMVYEKGLALFQLGQHLPPNHLARQRHLTEAKAIFAQLGSTYMLGQIEATIHHT